MGISEVKVHGGAAALEVRREVRKRFAPAEREAAERFDRLVAQRQRRAVEGGEG